MLHVHGMLALQLTTMVWDRFVHVYGTCVNVCVADLQSPTHCPRGTYVG
jgi:hypothetical protein